MIEENQLQKKNSWLNWIDVIIIVILIICVIIAVQYYFNTITKECISNPLVYASKDMEDKFGYPFRGIGSFQMNGQSPIISFDSTGVSLQNINNNPIFNTILKLEK